MSSLSQKWHKKYEPNEERDDNDCSKDADPDLPLEHGHELEDGLLGFFLSKQDGDAGLVEIWSNKVDNLSCVKISWIASMKKMF